MPTVDLGHRRAVMVRLVIDRGGIDIDRQICLLAIEIEEACHLADTPEETGHAVLDQCADVEATRAAIVDTLERKIAPLIRDACRKYAEAVVK